MHVQNTLDLLTGAELVLWLAVLGAAFLGRSYRTFPALIWLLSTRLIIAAGYNWINYAYAAGTAEHARAYSIYYPFYWLLYFVSTAASFFSLEQILRSAFAPLAGLAKLSVLVFRFTGALTLFIAITAHVTVLGHVPVMIWLQALGSSFAFCVCVFEITLVTMLLTYARRLGLSLRNRTLGIAAGFLVFGVADVAGVVAMLLPGPGQQLALLATELCTFMAVVIWTTYLILPDQKRGPLALKPSSPLMRWNEIVTQLGGPALPQPGASFMSEVESIVERIMVRNADRTV